MLFAPSPPHQTSFSRHLITRTHISLLFRVILAMHLTTHLLVGKLSLATISQCVIRTICITNVITLHRASNESRANSSPLFETIYIAHTAKDLERAQC